jgi:hypothetical protein
MDHQKKRHDSGAELSMPHLTAHFKASGSRSSTYAPAPADTLHALALRVRGEYVEMPGLQLTVLQAARLFGVAPDVAQAVLDDLRRVSVLTCSDRGTYSLSR